MTAHLLRLSGLFTQAVTVGLATASTSPNWIGIWLCIAGIVWLLQVFDVFIQADT